MPELQQPLFYFDGIEAMLQASFAFSQGISPSLATIVIPPQLNGLRSVGTLRIVQGSVTMSFPKCRVADMERSIDGEGREIWVLRILDRRWLWRETGKISGFYNEPRGLGITNIKRPRELAELCLRAMRERRYDLSQMPNDIFPEIAWEYIEPAVALAQLADAVQCRVMLTLDNRVKLVRVNQGQQLRASHTTLDGTVGLDPADPPGAVVIVGGRTQHQADLVLEPVAEDVDGRVLPVNTVSYTPRVGARRSWIYSDVDHFQDVPNLRLRGLAMKSVYRWYRIAHRQFLPGHGIVNNRNLILPLLPFQVETYRDESGAEQPRPAWIYGSYWDGWASHNAVTPGVVPNLLNQPRSLYTKGFSLDTETGIVKFGDPVYRMVLDNTVISGRRVFPANIRLRVAVNVREAFTGAWIHHEFPKGVPGGKKADPNAIAYEVRDDTTVKYFINYARRGILYSNLRASSRAAQHYLQIELAKYQATDSGGLTEAGFKKVELDGAITQITWEIDSAGFGRTRITRNRDELVATPSWKERRLFERIDRALKDRERRE